MKIVNSYNSSLSHLFSFLAINIIIGWGQSFYVIKLFCFILIGVLGLYALVMARKKVPRAYLVIIISILVSFIYHHVSAGRVLSVTSINFIINTVAPIVFGVLVYFLTRFVNPRIFIIYLKLFMSLSIVFIILQLFGFWRINLIFLSNDFIEMLAERPGAAYVGVSSSPFYMASQLALITPVLLSGKTGKIIKNNFFILVAFLSGQRAYLVTVLLEIIRKKVKVFWLLLILTMLFVLSVFLLVSGLGGIFFRGYDLDRLVLYLAGINYIAHYPMGVGSLLHYSNTVADVSRNNDILSLYIRVISEYPPHNAFINLAIVNGLWILAPVFYFVYKVYKLNNVFSWGFLFAIAISMFHNLSFLYADYFAWIILALAFHSNKANGKKNG